MAGFIIVNDSSNKLCKPSLKTLDELPKEPIKCFFNFLLNKIIT